MSHPIERARLGEVCEIEQDRPEAPARAEDWAGSSDRRNVVGRRDQIWVGVSCGRDEPKP